MSTVWDSKSPTSDLDFKINVYKRLAANEEIASVVWTPVDGLTFHNESIQDYTDSLGAVLKTKAIACVWISGGAEGVTYNVPVSITTNSVPPRTWNVNAVLKVKTETLK